MLPKPIYHPPLPDEIRGRVERVRAMMEEQNLNHYVAFSPDNVFYLTNFANFVHERPFILVVPRSGSLQFLVPKLEIPHVRTRAIGDLNLVAYPEFPAPAGDTWADHFGPLFAGNARVGVESICPLQVYDAIPGQRVRTDIIDDVRMIKSSYETGRIAYACDIASSAHKRLLDGAQPGRTLPQVASELSGVMMARILQDYPSTNLLATRLSVLFQPSSVSHDPHNFTDVNMAMEAGGPHVSIINCVVNGYGAEIERTFFLGHVPERAREPFEVMMAARRLAFELTVPGYIMGEVDRRVNEVFKKAGYDEFLLHRTGHGMGVTAHEAPFLAEGYDRVIEPGMFFTIEPGIYLPGVGGFRHSDTLMTTESANLILTDGPVELEDVTLPIHN
ncbi:MAG TPA: Xaa-Pro peptidase family protein [Anaerolineae bacterium]|nr:Xaa-Pro peptidase family protein [Anaerolineae bacterium]